MKAVIVHDSQAGNGERLAELMKETFAEAGADVQVDHVKARSAATPAEVAANPPDLLVIGAAVRKFVVSPPSKAWLKELNRELRRHGNTIGHAAVFLTHGLPVNVARRWGERFRRRVDRSGGITEVYPDWLSGRVVDVSGPFEEGTEEKFREHARTLASWVSEGR